MTCFRLLFQDFRRWLNIYIKYERIVVCMNKLQYSSTRKISENFPVSIQLPNVVLYMYLIIYIKQLETVNVHTFLACYMEGALLTFETYSIIVIINKTKFLLIMISFY